MVKTVQDRLGIDTLIANILVNVVGG